MGNFYCKECNIPAEKYINISKPIFSSIFIPKYDLDNDCRHDFEWKWLCKI